VRTLLATNDHRTRVIGAQYQTFLHRPVEASALANSLAFLTNGGTDEQLLGNLLASPEYTQSHQSDLSNAEFCDVLQRPIHLPDPYSPPLGPGLVALPEYAQVRVNNWYEQFVRRAPDPAELNSAVGGLEAGRSDEQTIASLLSSPAYVDMFKPKKAVSKPTVSPRGVIHFSLTRSAAVDMDVLRVLAASSNAGHSAAATGTPPPVLPTVRRVDTVSFGRRPSGRVTIRWSHKLRGHRLGPGRYLLQLKLFYGTRTTNLGDAIPFRVR
jgi:hypothetical protein